MVLWRDGVRARSTRGVVWVTGQQQPAPTPVAPKPVLPSWVEPDRAERRGGPWSSSGRPGPEGTTIARTRARVIAYIIDELLVGVAVIGLGLLLASFGLRVGFRVPPSGDPDAVPWRVAWTAVTVGCDLIYFVVMWTGGRRTIGMWLLRMRVVGEDARPLTVRPALLRWCLLLLVADILVWTLGALDAGIGLLLVGVGWPVSLLVTTWRDQDHQGLHDRFGHSLVISSRT